MTDASFATDRRTVLKGAAASAALLAPAAGLAQTRRDSDREAIRRAVDAGFEESVRRIQQWIALPTIAAEQLQHRRKAPIIWRGSPPRRASPACARSRPAACRPCSACSTPARARTVGIYFMYDVKQFDPAEWASPPLEGADLRSPARPRHPRPRRDQPEGAGRRLPRRAARLQGGEQAAAGQSRPARGGRGGDRLAQFHQRLPRSPTCSRRCAAPTG